MKIRFWIVALGVGCAVLGMRGIAQASARNWLGASLEVWTEYIDNRDSAGTGDGRESTFDIGVTPRLNVFARREVTLFDLIYAPTFRHRTNPADTQNEFNWFQELTGRVQHEAGRRTLLQLENRFNYSDDPEVTQGGDVLRRDNSYVYNQVSAGMKYALTRQVAAELDGAYDLKRFSEDEVADTSDEDRLSGQLRIQRQHNRALAYSVLGRYMDLRRDDAFDLNRDLKSYAVGGGIRNVFSPYLSGSMDAGAQWVDFSESSLSTYFTPFLQANVIFAASANTALYVGGVYSATEAYNYPFISQDMRSGYFGGSWRPVSRLTFGARGELRVESYELDQVDPATTDARYSDGDARDGDTRRVLLGGWVRWMIQKGFNLELRHNFEDVDSDVSVDFVRNATRLSMHVEF